MPPEVDQLSSGLSLLHEALEQTEKETTATPAQEGAQGSESTERNSESNASSDAPSTSVQDTAPSAPADTTTPAPATRVVDPLSDPNVQAVLQRQRQIDEQNRQAQLAAQAQAHYLNNLDDREYGAVVRQQQAVGQVYEQAANDVAVQVYNQVWGQVVSTLQQAGVPQESWPDPRSFNSFAELLQSVNGKIVDHQVQTKAEKLAEKLAEKKAEAATTAKLAELMGEYPTQPSFADAATGTIDIPSNASGLDILRAAEIQAAKAR